MPAPAFPSATALRRVSLRGAEHDTLSARQRLELALAGVDWTPPGFSPSAVLIVHRLGVTSHAKPGHRSPHGSLSEQVTDALRNTAGRARRPWLHADAVSAEAVWFADEGELAACLVHDWLRRTVGERWWWRSVLGKLGAREWLQAHVLPRGELLVPVLSLLAARSDAAAWLATLDAFDVRQAISAVVHAYALAPIDLPPAGVDPGVHGRGASDSLAVAADGRAVPDRFLAALPDEEVLGLQYLFTVVPEVRLSVLTRPQRHLLAVALAVSRAPSWARTAQLPSALRVLNRDGSAEIQAAPAETPITASPPRMPRRHTRRDAAPQRDWPRLDAPPEPNGQRAPMVRGAAAVPRHDPGAAPVSTSMPEFAVLDASPAVPLQAAELPPVRTETFEAPITLGRDPDTETGRSLRIETEFGGIFYLLNAALALELYGDFTAPRARTLPLLPWDWLALVGCAWFGDEFVRDPVWNALATLSGRTPDEEPGGDFVAPDAWTVPANWLMPWGAPPELRVHATRARLHITHPAGFAVFEVARDPARRPLAQARTLCAGHAMLRGARMRRAYGSVPGGRTRSSIACWLRCMLDYLQARLVLALGADVPAEVPALVCRHRAALTITAAAVDVHLSLPELPLSIRIAGLDRDAGWIPAAGRSLHFHFA